MDLSAPIGFLGESLGAELGAIAVPAIPELQRIVLNVPAASPVDVMESSPAFAVYKVGFDSLLGAVAHITPGSHDYDHFLDAARAEYEVFPNLRLRAGAGYDPSPSPSYTLSTSLPDSDRSGRSARATASDGSPPSSVTCSCFPFRVTRRGTPFPPTTQATRTWSPRRSVPGCDCDPASTR